MLTGCGNSKPEVGSIKGYDKGEEYLSIWVIQLKIPMKDRLIKNRSIPSIKNTCKYFADIEFIPRNDSGGGYSDKINASVMSGGLPDVLTVDGPNIAAYAENGIIQPLAKLSNKEKSAYLDSIIAQGTYDNKLYALGAVESSVGLYYNKDILAEAGVSVPDANHPWTWSEFLEVLKKVQPICEEKGGYPLDMTFPTGETTIYFYAPFFWSNGGDFVDKSGLKVDGIFNSKENLETVNYFKTNSSKWLHVESCY